MYKIRCPEEDEIGRQSKEQNHRLLTVLALRIIPFINVTHERPADFIGLYDMFDGQGVEQKDEEDW